MSLYTAAPQPYNPNPPDPFIGCLVDNIPIWSDYKSSNQLNSPKNFDGEPHYRYPDFRAIDINDPVFIVSIGTQGGQIGF